MSIQFWIEVFILFIIIILGYTVIFLKNYFNTNNKGRKTPVSTMIVFGSGGHTTEMVRLIKNLPKTRYSPRNYVVADNDNMSKEKMKLIENNSSDSALIEIPRSRAVHQSFFTSIFTTLNAMLYCFKYNYIHQPELIICNGPGTCIPVCYSALVLSWFMPWNRNGFGHIKIVYVESLARVKTLSLTGKLLLPTASLFIVQWPELYTKITGIALNSNGEEMAEAASSSSKNSNPPNRRIVYRNDLM